MKKLITFLLLASVFQVFGQKTIFKNYQSDYLKDIRDLSIYLPKSYEKDSVSNFPLTIVLDGQVLFDLYIGNSNFFTSTDKAPEQIIVGINMSETRIKDTSFEETSGELTTDAKMFYQFIKEELLPYVEANYKTSPFLSIVGTGLTGNFLSYFLREQNPIFNSYVSINPLLSPNASKRIVDFNLNRLASIDNTYYYYLSSNPYETPENATNIDSYKRTLENVTAKNFNFSYDEFRTAPSKISSISEAIPRTYSNIFELYSGISKKEFEEKVKDLDPPSAIAYVETKYLEIEYLFGTNMGIRERDIIAIEDIVINKENGDYLDEFGKMILKLYPNSQLGNYYLGLYYETGKKYIKALEQYRLGYGKMDPSDPNADKFYTNIERVLRQL